LAFLDFLRVYVAAMGSIPGTHLFSSTSFSVVSSTPVTWAFLIFEGLFGQYAFHSRHRPE
jgi:hypothetical protein